MKETREANPAQGETMGEEEKRIHSLLLEGFKKALLEMDIMHKKAVVELKSLEYKIFKLKEYQSVFSE